MRNIKGISSHYVERYSIERIFKGWLSDIAGMLYREYGTFRMPIAIDFKVFCDKELLNGSEDKWKRESECVLLSDKIGGSFDMKPKTEPEIRVIITPEI